MKKKMQSFREKSRKCEADVSFLGQYILLFIYKILAIMKAHSSIIKQILKYIHVHKLSVLTNKFDLTG